MAGVDGEKNGSRDDAPHLTRYAFTTEAKVPDIASDLLAASIKFTVWQRDALRRLAQGSLTEDDYLELVALAKDESAETGSSTLSAMPLAREHLSAAHGAGEVTQLLVLSGVEGVNALEAGQRLQFGHQGITIVFGRNGAGKSGYSRVLRSACRARKPPKILPDVTKGGAAVAPSAKFRVRTASGDQDVVWRGGHAAPEPLARLAVFDRECEEDIVDERGEATFVPPGLGMFDQLVAVVDEVKRRIGNEQNSALPTDDLAELSGQLVAADDLAKVVAAIKADQSGSKYTQLEAAVAAVTWEGTDAASLDLARRTFAEAGDPAARARTFRTLAASLSTLRTSIETADAVMGAAAVTTFRASLESAYTAKKANQLAQSGIDFSQEPAANIGAPIWQQLYKAAFAFATEGFSLEPRFPSPDAKCPLCLQDLDGPAGDRIKRFAAFMNDTTKVAADTARETHVKAVRRIADQPIPALDPLIVEQYASLLGDSGDFLLEIPKTVRSRRDWLAGTTSETNWGELPPFPMTIGSTLQVVEQTLEAKALEVEGQGDPAKRAELELAVKRLEARKAFFDQRTRITHALRQYAAAAKLGRIAGAMNTRTISVEGKAVAERAITAGLKSAFSDEMRRLGADGIVLADVSPAASKGKTTFGITISGATPGVKVGSVLSEGERRVIALAYFLAEIQMAPARVGIILDDPVSSLDHWWAERIAQRIAELGVDRQVIVFTHSIALVVEIEKHATFSRAPVTQLFIEKSASGAGRCSPEAAPWDSMSVGMRLDTFRKQLPEIRSEYTRSPTGRDYARMAAQFCSDLRSTWERAVEEFVFCGVIERFGNSVSTGRLNGVVCTTDTFRQVNEAMTKLSAVVSAHDKAKGAFATCPRPDELSAFVANVESFVTYQKGEKKKAVAERTPYEKTAVLPTP